MGKNIFESLKERLWFTFSTAVFSSYIRLNEKKKKLKMKKNPY